MINKTYILVFNETNFTRDDLVKFVESQPEAPNWFYCIAHTVFVVTSLEPKELSHRLERKFGRFRHFITEVTLNRWGRMPGEQWDSIR